LLAISVVLFVHMIPTWLAVIVPGWAGWRAFGPDKWLSRRVLVGWLVFGAIGYAVLFALSVLDPLRQLPRRARSRGIAPRFPRLGDDVPVRRAHRVIAAGE
jgi:hypothetical protein